MNWFVISYIFVSYLVGSISSAIILSRFYKLADIRSVGSGNPGATNMVAVGGKKLALCVLIFDMLKGTIIVFIAYKLQFLNYQLGFIAVAVCIGHIYPIFFGFQGGKGVATAMGAMALIHWVVATSMIFIWLITFLITGYSSLSAIIMATLLPGIVWLVKPAFTFPVSMVSCLLIFRHFTNIKRLLSGTEKNFKKNNNHL